MNIATFWMNVKKTENCWRWQGKKLKNGYGYFSPGGGPGIVYVHRFSYELKKGLIPPKYVIDHLCRNSDCVNPDHLEAVTNRENVMRGILSRTNGGCRKGHSKDDRVFLKNGRSICSVCKLIYNKERYQRLKRPKKPISNEQLDARKQWIKKWVDRGMKTYCRKGLHPSSIENISIDKKGERECIPCRREYKRIRKEKGLK